MFPSEEPDTHSQRALYIHSKQHITATQRCTGMFPSKEPYTHSQRASNIHSKKPYTGHFFQKSPIFIHKEPYIYTQNSPTLTRKKKIAHSSCMFHGVATISRLLQIKYKTLCQCHIHETAEGLARSTYSSHRMHYGVATVSRLLTIISLFCRRAL